MPGTGITVPACNPLCIMHQVQMRGPRSFGALRSSTGPCLDMCKHPAEAGLAYHDPRAGDDQSSRFTIIVAESITTK